MIEGNIQEKQINASGKIISSRGRPKRPTITTIYGKDVIDRPNIEDFDDEQEKIVTGTPTQEDYEWIKQKSFEMRRATAMKREATIQSRKSIREKLFWERVKNEKANEKKVDEK